MTGMFDRDAADIVIDTAASAEAGAKALDVSRCEFDDRGHDWVETTAMTSIKRSWVCHCGAIGKEG